MTNDPAQSTTQYHTTCSFFEKHSQIYVFYFSYHNPIITTVSCTDVENADIEYTDVEYIDNVTK